MDGFVADVRASIRALARSRGFTAAAVATLALGIGANASVFAVARGVLLRPLPFAAPLGVRMALGARRAHVRRLVLRQGVGVAALGVVGGLAAASALVGLMQQLLFETEASNPLVFGAMAVLLLVLAGAAS